MRYSIYQDETETRALAFETGSELEAVEAERGLRYIATIEATPYREFSPRSSAFQSEQSDEYIETGMAWPFAKAVVVH